MSKERELLERSIELIDQYWDDSKVGYPRDVDNRKLFYEIEELLAQPEQEPVEDRIARWHKLGYEQGRKSALNEQEREKSDEK